MLATVSFVSGSAHRGRWRKILAFGAEALVPTREGLL